MNFSTILWTTLGVYVTYILGNVIYDIFFRKDKQEEIVVDEDEVDISDMAGEIMETKEVKKSDQQQVEITTNKRASDADVNYIEADDEIPVKSMSTYMEKHKDEDMFGTIFVSKEAA